MTPPAVHDDSLADIQPALDRYVISHLELMKDLLIATAHNLAAGFKEERRQLQQAAVATLPQVQSRRPPSTYASINLSARYHNCSLELYWKKATRLSRGGKSIFHDLRRNAEGEYSKFVLFRVAQPWEQALVLDYEQRARLIRERWHYVCQCLDRARQIRKTTRPTPAHTEQVLEPLVAVDLRSDCSLE